MSIAEAFAAGTPVICSDLGNVGSLVIEGITGAKFAADSQEKLVQAVKRLQRYENIHHSTFEIYEHFYSKEQNYERLIETYQNAKSS